MADAYLVLSPEQLEQADAARAEANNILASRGVPGYSAAPPPAPAVSSVGASAPQAELPPAGPPAPPPKDSPMVRGLKQGAKMAAGSLLGPAGVVAAAASNHAQLVGDDPGAKRFAEQLRERDRGPSSPASTGDEFGPPAPLPPTEDPPIMLANRSAGAGQLISPAGMYPQSMTAQAHMGRPVPEEAKAASAASTLMGLEAADKQRSADQSYQAGVYNLASQRMAANDAAMANHARVQADRDQAVRNSISKMEALNAQANAAVAPDKYWTDRGALAPALGAIFVALGEFGASLTHRTNTAKAIVDAGVNREIQGQLENRRIAGQGLSNQQKLLDLHLDQLGSQDKAIEATKTGLYDGLGIQMDALAQQRGINISDANYLRQKADILSGRADAVNKYGLQEQDDITRAYTESWHNAQYGGGTAGPSPEDPHNIITIPASDKTGEKTVRVAVPESAYKELSAMQGQTNALVELNKAALETRKQLREAAKRSGGAPSQEVNTLRKRLEGLNDQRAKLAEKAADPNSAVRDAEFQRQMQTQVDYTAGFMGHDLPLVGVDTEKAIENSSNTAQRLTDARLRGATGEVVQHGVTRAKDGSIVNRWLPTGQIYGGKPVAPEKK